MSSVYENACKVSNFHAKHESKAAGSKDAARKKQEREREEQERSAALILEKTRREDAEMRMLAIEDKLHRAETKAKTAEADAPPQKRSCKSSCARHCASEHLHTPA